MLAEFILRIQSNINVFDWSPVFEESKIQKGLWALTEPMNINLHVIIINTRLLSRDA
jgi:hypothetical protein